MGERERILEDLLTECLERYETEGPAAVEDVCSRYPAFAGDIRAQLKALHDVGLPPRERGALPAWMPERIGDFEPIESLGKGGMGLVVLARQRSLGRLVALKVIDPVHVEDGRGRFLREIEALSRLQHPNIVPVYSGGEESGLPYYAMERVLGCTLAEALSRLSLPRTPWALLESICRCTPGKPSAEEFESAELFGKTWEECCLRIVLQIAQALAYAHGEGVFHRDVKPANILVTPNGGALLFDFGLARIENCSRLTTRQTELGSLPYMPPERLLGSEPEGSPLGDIYSLGVTLYELLAGTLPYPIEDGAEHTRALIRAGKPPSMRPKDVRISWDAETICLKAMEVSPARRYHSMEDFVEDLRRALQGLPIKARRAPVLLRAYRLIKRHPTKAATLLFLLLAPTVWAVKEREARARIMPLSDAHVVRYLLEEERKLFPATPEMVSGRFGMDDWLARARDVIARKPRYERELALLRKRATANDGSSTARAWEAEARRRLAELQDEREGIRLLGRKDPLVSKNQEKIDEVSFALREKAAYAFDDPADLWLHDTLVDLIHSTELVERKAIPEVQKRRDFALSVTQRTVGDYRDQWHATIDAIATGERYAGLRITPQRGLVPLGQDPDSGLFEFAHLETGRPPTRDSSGKLHMSEETGLVFVLLPGCKVWIGCEKEASDGAHNVDPYATDWEMPADEVQLSPFFISKYEMTQAEWLRVTGENPSTVAPGFENGGHPVTLLHPVEGFNWYEARELLWRLGLLLPTEAQWEHAARGRAETIWWTGQDPLSLRGAANLCDLAYSRTHRDFQEYEPWLEDGYDEHAPVGSFRANRFGLYDVIGNVRERCLDGDGPKRNNPARAGDGRRYSGEDGGKAVRGGSFWNLAKDARSGHKGGGPAGSPDGTAGVRPVRMLEP